jgi:hypothetical protein
MRTVFRRFIIDPETGAVTDRGTGRKVGYVTQDGDGNWRGGAFVGDGREYRTGPWLSAYAAADAAWLVATAEDLVTS